MVDDKRAPLALISVSDKSHLLELASGLRQQGYEILASDGTSELLSQHGVAAQRLSDYTGHPEILDGRVKTLHPKIHAGILFDRTKATHRDEIQRRDIRSIDLVIVNLYPFEKEALDGGLSLDAASSWIDIGGPTMLRAAAKNWQHCLAVIDPADYAEVLAALSSEAGFSEGMRQRFATKVFASIAAYDQLIYQKFLTSLAPLSEEGRGAAAPTASHPVIPRPAERSGDLRQRAAAQPNGQQPPSPAEPGPAAFQGDHHALPERVSVHLERALSLRYGENPQQTAAFYQLHAAAASGLADVRVLQGKELSYNNLLDCDAAAYIVQCLLPQSAVVIVKHTNPCGAAASATDSLEALFGAALAADPTSAFGGIIACNRGVDGRAALAIAELFCECIVAPTFSAEACEIFARKKSLRLVEASWLGEPATGISLDWRSIAGGWLLQQSERQALTHGGWQLASGQELAAATRDELLFAMEIARHVKSNAIVLALGRRTIGIGAGQMSRIDALNLAIRKAHAAGHSTHGACLASDAFFPFADCVELAAEHGIQHIVQPGGSRRDGESIAAAQHLGLTMYMTHERYFKH